MALPAFFTVFIALSTFTHATSVSNSSSFNGTSFNASSISPFPIDPGFPIRKVLDVAVQISNHSWEFGTCAVALLEIYNPEYSVFGSFPFPVPTLNKEWVPSLSYAASKIVIGQGPDSLSPGANAVGDPSALGQAAVMLGKTEVKFALAALSQLFYTVTGAPRMWNDAISTRVDIQEVWADFMYMFPPFYAYYAADNEDLDMLEDSYRQCGLYRQILQTNTTKPWRNVWEHIIGPQNEDRKLWSTGNGWSSMGMARVLATIMKAPVAQNATWRDEAIGDLTMWIREIIEGAMNAPVDYNKLLRNYLNDTTGATGYGEFSGTAMMSAVVYRMAVLRPDIFTEEHINWAENNLLFLTQEDPAGFPHVNASGFVAPTVNPLNWGDPKPFMAGSPECQSFVVLLYAAWRDYTIL